MENGNKNRKKQLALKILAPLFCTIGGISLLMSSLEDHSKPTLVVACIILLLDLVMIVAFFIDGLRKR